MSRLAPHLELTEFTREHRGAARLVAAGGLALLAILSALAGGWLFSLWILIFVVMTGIEWHGIAYRSVRSPAFALHMAGAALALAFATLGHVAAAYGVLVFAALTAALGARLAGSNPLWAALGTLYTGVPGLTLIWLRAIAEPGAATLFWLFAVVWATDMAALAVGQRVGGPKLCPAISPKKTWSGLAGGVLGAALVGVVTGLLVPGASALALAGLSGLLAVVAQLGDLTESAFKRRFGVKDSGFLIPGQGGVLDRVDGLIFVAVVVAALAWAMGGAVLILGGTP